MKVFILCVLIAASQAAVIAPALFRTGSSTQYKSQDNIGNYNFGYNEGHLSGGTFRKEAGDAFGNKIGSYGLTDADGRSRVVNYIADAAGFRADIQTNEPGVESKDPASASINKANTVAPAPVVAYSASAPVVSYAAAPAPVVSYAAPAPFVSYSAPNAATTAFHYSAPAPVSYNLAASPLSLRYAHGLPILSRGIIGTHLI